MSRHASPPPQGDRPTPPPQQQRLTWRLWLFPVAMLIVVLVVSIWSPGLRTSKPNSVGLGYSEFLSDVDSHQVKTITIESSGKASGALTDGRDYTTTIPAQAGPALLDRMEKAGVAIAATPPANTTSVGSQVLSWVLIIGPFAFLFWWLLRMGRRGAGQLGTAMGVGKSKAKVFDTERPGTTFDDVAGYSGAKAEVSEVVDFLRAPERYRRAGAVAPRGVLMIGPPGTGKTLFARAVAGQAEVPFLSVAGSSFVEMYVGVGAARVRDLFAEARKRAPAIVFVDEIDAIGSRRGGSGSMVANDEREQTLNQLLSEMDGFDPAVGIVVLAATNRPEVLDPALLRPGRFDRQVTIPLPTLAERASILAVHCRGKHLGPDVDMQVIARGTPGFSGADLANLANEAAICAVRDDREVIRAADFDTARDRILLGRREGSNVLLPEEKYAVAVHESGHALVAALSEHADPVAKVTILPAGQTLGTTEQLPLVERHLYGQDYLTDTLAVRLGGRAAERVVFDQGSTGAANDLAQATELATKMVREFGLSTSLGPVGYPQGGSVFLGGGGAELTSRPFAEATQAAIDADVSRLLREAENRALDLIESHRDALQRLVTRLLEHETVDGTEVYTLLGVAVPADRSGSVPAATVAPHRGARTTPTPVTNGRQVQARHAIDHTQTGTS
ncbi:ATP-dependent zinc metalloprotease FtsH [Nocardia pseudobrasiliensis]|uniref:ATP-dependent zinc metalloprotease FtsH n=1 Tax=Nocardia pseudobrasiliensis TaxID=45979 RepID=A0A370HPL1_9NOCA|nr:ATP-dependent zinc metalloprotease FtsH [Nocardia pseudobrasiliensis]RDI60479.1 cell division protease FtsH [Nocardia pseudobrasiliensis]